MFEFDAHRVIASGAAEVAPVDMNDTRIIELPTYADKNTHELNDGLILFSTVTMGYEVGLWDGTFPATPVRRVVATGTLTAAAPPVVIPFPYRDARIDIRKTTVTVADATLLVAFRQLGAASLGAGATEVTLLDCAAHLAALETHQTDGTQKSVVRGGAKGTTAAADVTSRSIGTNAQALDVYDSSPMCIPGNWSTARGDATAVRLADTTVTFTGPAIVSSQIRRVMAFIDSTTRPNVWEQGKNAVISIAGTTITVTAIDGNAAPIPVTTTLVVVDWVASDKSYDQSLQAARNAPMYDVRSFRQTDLVALLGANQTITNSWADVGPEILLDGSTDFRGWFDITKGDGTVTTVQARLLLKHTAGGAAEYAQPVSKVDVSAAPYTVTMSDEEPYLSVLDASCQRTALWRVGNTAKYAQLQIKASTPGTTMVLTATGTGYTMGWGG